MSVFMDNLSVLLFLNDMHRHVRFVLRNGLFLVRGLGGNLMLLLGVKWPNCVYMHVIKCKFLSFLAYDT